MRHESKFAAWIKSGGNSVFVLPLGPVPAPEVKFSVVPDRLLDSIIDDALPLETYIWRSQDDARVRAAHADDDDQVFAWSAPPSGGHPGQNWNCRCTAEPIIDPQLIPESAVCDILTGDRLSTVIPDAPAERLAAIARALDLRIVSGSLDGRERLIAADPQAAYSVNTQRCAGTSVAV